MKKKTFDPNMSIVGWYIAALIERFEFYDEDLENSNRRCEAWENFVLIKAANPEVAYRKAMAIGKQGEKAQMQTQTPLPRKGVWRFEGISILLPIYEKLEDGAEIMWTKHQNISVKKVRAKVKPKEHLQAFQGL
jgi:hypothetical protein